MIKGSISFFFYLDTTTVIIFAGCRPRQRVRSAPDIALLFAFVYLFNMHN